ncbi:MAG TPA: hypothetical protein VKA21_13950 [Candidatus Binatia bacterium]|nr:hypothetical protein [Candidatus Binatia bacterium]
MAIAKGKTAAGRGLSQLRASVGKEIRDLERRVLKGLHAATEEQVGRLERRVARLEHAFADLKRAASGEQAA